MTAAPDAAALVGALALTAACGFPGLLARRGTRVGERLGALLAVAGAVLGLVPAVRSVLGIARVRLTIPAPLPGAAFTLATDPLSGAFLVPVFLVGGLGAVYGLGYWPDREHPENGRRLRLAYGLLVASMGLVTVARTGLLFLFAWEVMALSAFFAATAEDEKRAVRRAGFRYLAATHTGSLALFAMVALLAKASGSFAWEPLAAAPRLLTSSVFLLALLGFGLKAGIVPLHFWLPEAHANAPSHVSALLSGLMLKMGLYGILRVASLHPDPPAWWGGLLLVAGLASALSGVALAAVQDDLKRLLAYSSVENVGIVAMGIGLALLGRSLERPEWVVLGLAAAVLHVFFHALFKPLLFFSAGAVLHAAGTGRISELGGLLRGMPRTTLAFGIGSLAVCGLPPLNGFASELLLYLGLASAWIDGPRGLALAAFAAAGLALAGGLAVATFVKALGLVFLGAPRSTRATAPHDGPAAMTLPILALAAACLVAGLVPLAFAGPLDRVVAAFVHGEAVPRVADVAPLAWVTAAGAALLLLAAVVALVLSLRLRRHPRAQGPTWDCGYALPSSSMQYTSGSLGDALVRLLPRSLRPQREVERPAGLFPRAAAFSQTAEDPFFRLLYLPLLRSAGDRLSRLRAFQHGKIGVYVLYVLLALVALLAWAEARVLLGAG